MAEHNRVKRLLWEWGATDRRVEELVRRMRNAKARMDEMYEIGAPAGAGGGGKTKKRSDPVFRAFERAERIRQDFAAEAEACEREIQRAKEFERKMDSWVSELPPKERDVITQKYKKGRSWVYISIVMECDESTVYRCAKRAVEALAEKIKFEPCQ